MENFIDQLWQSYCTLESQILLESYTQKDLVQLKKELVKKIMELKIFLLEYQWKDKEEQNRFLYLQSPNFASSLVFVSHLKNIDLKEKLMTHKSFQVFTKHIRKRMEMFCSQVYPMVCFSRLLIENKTTMEVATLFDDWKDYMFPDEDIPQEENIFAGISRMLGKYDAYKRLLSMTFSKTKTDYRKSNVQNANSIPQPPLLQWTDSGISLTEMAYALKYSGSINQGNVEVKTIADTLANVFNTAQVNTYRNKQDLYSRRNQSMFLDRLRKALILGLEQSDPGL